MDEDAVVARLAQVWRAGASDDPRAQFAGWRKRETDREYRLSIGTPASQRLMVLVCERYSLKWRSTMKTKTCHDSQRRCSTSADALVPSPGGARGATNPHARS